MASHREGIALGLELKKRARARSRNLSRIRELHREWSQLRRYDGAEAFAILVDWVRERFIFAGAKRAILGVSGGVDSSLVACVLAKAMPGRKTQGYLLPFGASGRDEKDAARLLELLGIPYKRIDLSPVLEAFRPLVSNAESDGNLKTRLRTATLFHEAAAQQGLFVGTGDLDEGFVGYYTKGSGSDLSPIGSLHKTEVRALLRLALSKYDKAFAKKMSEKPADAGLIPGRLAEDELGVRYDDIARAIDVVLEICDLFEGGAAPRDLDVFAESYARSGVNRATFLKVMDLIARARHKAATPTLWRREPALYGNWDLESE